MNARVLIRPTLACLALAGCANPHQPSPQAVFSPDRAFFFEVDTIAAPSHSSRHAPTWRITLYRTATTAELVVADELETMCGIIPSFSEEGAMKLRVPWLIDRDKLTATRQFEGIPLFLEFHEDWIMQQVWDPTLSRKLVLVRNCFSTFWNVYLREKGEVTFNEEMKRGWEDPSLVGGFPWDRPMKEMKFTGPRRAVIHVDGSPQGVQVRRQVRGVNVEWKFNRGQSSRKTAEDTQSHEP